MTDYEKYQNEQKYRYENNITGSCYYLKFSSGINNDFKSIIKPIGLYLTTKKKYYISACPMTWEISSVTDDEEYFDNLFDYGKDKDGKVNFKGIIRDVDCWYVLSEIQRCFSYQSWCQLSDDLINNMKRLETKHDDFVIYDEKKKDILTSILLSIFDNSEENIFLQIFIVKHLNICFKDEEYRYKYEPKLQNDLISLIDKHYDSKLENQWLQIKNDLESNVYIPNVFKNSYTELTYHVKMNLKNKSNDEIKKWTTIDF